MSGKGHLKWSKDQHFVDPVAFLLPGAFLAFMTQPMICEIECCIKITLPTPFTSKNIKVQLRSVWSSPDDIPAVEEPQQETGIQRIRSYYGLFAKLIHGHPRRLHDSIILFYYLV